MRKRSQGSIESTPVSCTQYLLDGSQREILTGSISNGSKKTMSDIVTPGFKKISAKGGIVDSPMSKTELTVLEDPMVESTFLHLVDKNGATVGYSRWRGDKPVGKVIPTASDIDVDTLVGAAMNNCLASINPSLAAAGVSYAERRETAGYLRKIGRDVINILRSVRKADKKFLKKEISLAKLEERYMEARYALRPLMIDAEQLFKVTQRQVITKSKYRKTVRGRASDSGFGDETRTFGWRGAMDANISYDVRAQRTTHVSVRAWATVEYGFDTAAGNEWAHLGLNDWASIGWEIIPFSFIVDWFFTTADFVGTFNPTFGATIISSGYTVETTTVTTQRVVDSAISPYSGPHEVKSWQATVSGGACSTLEVSKTRNIGTLKRHWPNLDVRLDVFKLTDLAIIAKNLLPKRG